MISIVTVSADCICCHTGTKVKETVYLVNNEPTAYRFSIVEKSCHCDGHAGQLVVEPMSGIIQPNTRYSVYTCTCSFTLILMYFIINITVVALYKSVSHFHVNQPNLLLNDC